MCRLLADNLILIIFTPKLMLLRSKFIILTLLLIIPDKSVDVVPDLRDDVNMNNTYESIGYLSIYTGTFVLDSESVYSD